LSSGKPWRSCPPATADNGQQPQPVVAQKRADEPDFHMPILKPAWRGHRRRIDKPGLANSRSLSRLALQLQPAFDPLLGLLPQLLQRLKHQQLQLVRRPHPPHRHPGVHGPRTEPALLLLVPGIRQILTWQRQDRVLIQQENQPRQTPLGGGHKLQLGIGQLRLVLDW
jgi:hypothetical protein